MSIIIENSAKQEQLHHTFPQLAESKQHYVLGLAEGLKYAQERLKEIPKERGGTGNRRIV